jgi:hypothetical protein
MFIGFNGKLIGAPKPSSLLAFQGNVYSDPATPLTAPTALGKSLQDLDPGAAPARPVSLLQFDPLPDPSQAGVYGDPAWTGTARALPMPGPYQPPANTPVTFTEHFEASTPGYPPARFQVETSGQGDSILVMDAPGSPVGRHLLRMMEPAGLPGAVYPIGHAEIDHLSGTLSLELDVIPGKGSGLSIELRQYAPTIVPFYRGPALRIFGGALHVADPRDPTGSRTLPAPEDQWLHLKIMVGLGPKADGTWTLRLGEGAGAQFVTGLPCGSGRSFTAATWLGFTNCVIPVQTTTCGLDNITLSNVP